MIRAPEMRSPAPRANAENRAKVIHNGNLHTIAGAESEAGIAARCRFRPLGLALPLACTVAALANIARAFE
jgi:hypothetical protein